MIVLSEEVVSGFNRAKADENLLYLRYLVIRERDPDKLTRYYSYIEMLERRITLLNIAESVEGYTISDDEASNNFD